MKTALQRVMMRSAELFFVYKESNPFCYDQKVMTLSSEIAMQAADRVSMRLLFAGDIPPDQQVWQIA